MSENFGSLARKRILFIIIVGYVTVAAIQLFNMQILNGPVYNERSNENSVKPIYQNAPRGILYDRNGNVLVGNKPSFSLRITPSEYNDTLNPYLESILKYEKGYISKILKANESYSKYIPRRIAKDVDFSVIAWYEENSAKLKGVDYVMETQRDYSFGVMGAHMFGYTKEIPPSILQKRKNEYMMGDEIGFSGIEKTYEEILRGKKGVNYVLVDSRQKTIGNFKDGKENIPTVKGYDLILGIDKDAQKVAEEAFKEKRGAVVAIEPSTGEIIAFVSAPEFNLNEFATVTTTKKFNELLNDKNKPLLNRATMGYYSPGSTFKMVSAIAALEEGLIDTTSRISCPGGFQFGNHFFKCLHTHGSTDIYTSIEKSCNTFYYSTVVKLGLDRWSKYSKLFGFGQKTGVDISEEYSGILPSTEYYNKVYGKNGWTKGFVVSLGIGQGELSVTPIQLAKYASIIANYGKTAKPHFVKAYIDTKTHQRTDVKPEYIDIGISKKTFDIVRKAMWLVVNGAGTAVNIKDPKLNIAGKTGTAQNPHGEDHAVFVGFAPYDNPKIAIAVIVENAGFGSTAAAPVARDVIKAFLIKDNKENIQSKDFALMKDKVNTN